jgi:hypothetical protein
MPLTYAPGIDGAAVLRVRETYVRDWLAPAVSGRRAGAAKLDLALRAIAFAGPEPASGEISPDVSWEQLHDLVRPGDFYAENRSLKRKWVSDKLAILEGFNLVQRVQRPGGRSQLVVLSDRHDGSQFDSPDGSDGNSYVTFLGTLISFGHFARWGGPELAAYIAAITAERYARAYPPFANAFGLSDLRFGGGVWSRPYSWFSEPGGFRPEAQIRFPFSEHTLQRGFRSLAKSHLVSTWRFQFDPIDGEEYEYPRQFHWNGFDDLRPGRGVRLYNQLPVLVSGQLTSRGKPTARTDQSAPFETRSAAAPLAS